MSCGRKVNEQKVNEQKVALAARGELPGGD